MPLKGMKKVKRAVLSLSAERNNHIKAVYLDGLGKIISGTPADTGRARNNWFLSVGSPSSSTTTNTGDGQKITLPDNVLNQKIYLTNNLPYIGTLEYGGFPDPVKKGSYIKKSKSYEKLSSGGFSKQAPNGWVRKTLIKMQNKIRSL